MNVKYFYIYLSGIFAMAYWLFDSSIHYLVFGEAEFEFIPQEVNELWMRLLICVLIFCFGVVVEISAQKLKKKEREKSEVYESMLNATQHILNNFLNRMLLFKEAAEESKDIDKEILGHYERVISETTKQIRDLENIKDPSKEKIEERYKPH